MARHSAVRSGRAVSVFPRLWGRCRHRERASERRHRRYRAAAERVLTKLPEGGAGVKYLRKINPYVFEELLLLAFERRGWRSSVTHVTAEMVARMVRC